MNRNNVNFKQKYKELKLKLRSLIYENETYQEQLKQSQNEYLQVTKDRSFLLKRLLAYEDVSDSDSTDCTDESDAEIICKSMNDLTELNLSVSSKKKKPDSETATTKKKSSNNLKSSSKKIKTSASDKQNKLIDNKLNVKKINNKKFNDKKLNDRKFGPIQLKVEQKLMETAQDSSPKFSNCLTLNTQFLAVNEVKQTANLADDALDNFQNNDHFNQDKLLLFNNDSIDLNLNLDNLDDSNLESNLTKNLDNNLHNNNLTPNSLNCNLQGNVPPNLNISNLNLNSNQLFSSSSFNMNNLTNLNQQAQSTKEFESHSNQQSYLE